MLLGTPAVAVLLWGTSLSISPAPLPGPAHARVEPLPLASLAWGLNWLYLLDHAKHQKGLSLGLASQKQPSEWA